jgi:hypothetical protein
MATTNPIDEYLAALDEPKRTTLTSLRDTIMAIVPDAEQCISYGLPGAGVHSRFLLLSAMGGGASPNRGATWGAKIPRGLSRTSFVSRSRSGAVVAAVGLARAGLGLGGGA